MKKTRIEIEGVMTAQGNEYGFKPRSAVKGMLNKRSFTADVNVTTTGEMTIMPRRRRVKAPADWVWKSRSRMAHVTKLKDGAGYRLTINASSSDFMDAIEKFKREFKELEA